MKHLLKPISAETLSRRDLLEWLGKGAVLTLGGPAFLSACSTSGEFRPAGGDEDRDFPDREAADSSSFTDGDTLTDGDTPIDGDLDNPEQDTEADRELQEGDYDFPFAPPEPPAEIFENWWERTVDPQDLQSILSSWRLRIDGLVRNPVTLRFADLVDLPRLDALADFHCVEGWSIYDIPWNGVSYSTLIELVQPTAEASHVTTYSIGDKYLESLPLSVAREPLTMLAYGVNGSTLPLSHGFPLRTVVPRLLGYKGGKFINRLEFTNEAIQGFWVERGYPYDGEVPPGRLREGRY